MLKRLIDFLFVVSAKQKGKTIKVHCEENKCTLCGKCQKICPRHAIMVDGRSWIYYSYRCTKCGFCINGCPACALEFIEE
jgi:MinD superfamily P-loop ATPase